MFGAVCACRKKDVPISREKALMVLEKVVSKLNGEEDESGYF